MPGFRKESHEDELKFLRGLANQRRDNVQGGFSAVSEAIPRRIETDTEGDFYSTIPGSEDGRCRAMPIGERLHVRTSGTDRGHPQLDTILSGSFKGVRCSCGCLGRVPHPHSFGTSLPPGFRLSGQDLKSCPATGDS